MKLTVFGDDLVGLVTATSLAKEGNEVICVPLDSLSQKYDNKKLLCDEPGLAELMDTQLEEKNLSFETSWDKAISKRDIISICFLSEHASLAEDLLNKIGKQAQENTIVINQSTFDVGTVDAYQAILKEYKKNISVMALPNFFSEGSAIQNFNQPDRIVLGSVDNKAIEKVKKLLKPFVKKAKQVLVMSPREAEYSKFATNALLATRMSLVNEMANTAESFNVDFEQVKKALGMDSRIGFNYINPGCGFGGPNFAADVAKLVFSLAEQGFDVQLLQKVLENNENQKEVMFRKVWRYFNANLKDKTFAIWGLSFKPNTSTVENGSSIKTIEALIAQGAKVQVYDPKAMESFKTYWQGEDKVVYAEDMYEALNKVDGLLLMTEWGQFENPEFDKMKSLMNIPIIFDGRNIFNPAFVDKQGFEYFGVGRGQAI